MINTKLQILSWLQSHGIENGVIKLNKNKDWIVDVPGNVDLSHKRLATVDVKFGIVEGSFTVAVNFLTSLSFCPEIVGGNFSCSYNRLSSLEGGPTKVGGNYYCTGNRLVNLKGVAKHIDGGLFAGMNRLNSLEFLPLTATEVNFLTNPLLGDRQGVDDFEIIKSIQKIELEKINLSKSISLPVSQKTSESLNSKITKI